LTLELPESKLKDQLEEMGIDPTIEQGLVMRVLLTAIQDGNYKALEAIARLIQQTTTPADKKEQKARTEQMQLANERLKLELDPSQAGMKDDGFIEALQQEVADVWADEEPPSD
jgi:exoribonuclease R